MRKIETVGDSVWDAFNAISQVLVYTGIWPCSSTNRFVVGVHNLRRVYHMWLTIHIIVTGVWKSTAESASVKDFFTDAATIFAAAQLFPLLLFLSRYPSLLLDMLREFLELQERVYSGDSRHDSSTISLFKKFKIIFRASYAVAFVEALLMSVYYGYIKNRTIFNAYYPINTRVQFIITLGLECIQGLYMAAVHMGFLAVFILMIEILSGELDQLEYLIRFLDVEPNSQGIKISEHFSEEWNDNLEEYVCRKNLPQHLIELVQIHQEIYRHLMKLENAFTYAFLLFLPGNVLSACLAIFLLLTVPEMLHITIACSLIIIINLILCCLFANKVSEKTTSLRDAIYACNWYNYDKANKKTIQVMMARCDSSFVLTAGKVMPLSIHTMVKILQEIMGYILVMFNVSGLHD